MWRVGGNVGRLAGSHNRFCAPESDLDFTFENGKHLLEIVAMRRWAAAGRDKHVNKTVAASGVFSGQKDRVGVSSQSNVRQGLVFVRSRNREISLEIIGRNC